MRVQLIGGLAAAALIAVVVGAYGPAAATAVLGSSQPGLRGCDSVRCMTGESSGGTAFVSEDVDPGDAWLLSGKFTAHWESEDGSATIDGPAGVSIGDALRWARGKAPTVVLIVDDEAYSAGKKADPSLPLWVDDGSAVRPRPAAPGSAESNGELFWVLESTVACRDGAPAVDALRSALRGVAIDDMVAHDHACLITYRVEAHGSVEAVRSGSALLEGVVENIQGSVGDDMRVIGTKVLGPA